MWDWLLSYQTQQVWRVNWESDQNDPFSFLLFTSFWLLLELRQIIKSINNLLYIGGFFYVYQFNVLANQTLITLGIHVNSSHYSYIKIPTNQKTFSAPLSLSSFFISAEPFWKNFNVLFTKFKWNYVLVLLPTILVFIWGVSIILFFFIGSTRKRLTILILMVWLTVFILFMDFFLFFTSNRKNHFLYASLKGLTITLLEANYKGFLNFDTLDLWPRYKVNNNGLSYLLNTSYTKTKENYILKNYYTFSKYKLNAMPEYLLKQSKINEIYEQTRKYTGMPFYWFFAPTTLYESMLYWNTVHLGGFSSNIDQQLINVKSEHLVKSYYGLKIDKKLKYLNSLDEGFSHFLKTKNKYSCNYKKVTTQIRKINFRNHIIQIEIFPKFYYLSLIEKFSIKNHTAVHFALNRVFGQHFHLTNPAIFPVIFIATIGSIFVVLFSSPNNLFNSSVNHLLPLFTKKSIKKHLKEQEHAKEFLEDWLMYQIGGAGYMELLSLDNFPTKKHTVYHLLRVVVNQQKPKVFKVGFVFYSTLLILQTCATNSSFWAISSFTILTLSHLWYHKYYLKWTLEAVKNNNKQKLFTYVKNVSIHTIFYLIFGALISMLIITYDSYSYFLVLVLFLWLWSYVGLYFFYEQNWQAWAIQRTFINLGFITFLLLFFVYFREGRCVLFPPILPFIICSYFFIFLRLWKAFYLMKSYGAYASYFLVLQPLLLIMFFQIWIKEIGDKSLCIFPLLLIYESIKATFTSQKKYYIKSPAWKSASAKTQFFFFFFLINNITYCWFFYLEQYQFVWINIFLIAYYFCYILSTIWITMCSSVAQSDKVSSMQGAATQIRFAWKIHFFIWFGFIFLFAVVLFGIFCYFL